MWCNAREKSEVRSQKSEYCRGTTCRARRLAAKNPGTGRQFGSQARKRLEFDEENAQAPEQGERWYHVSSSAHFVGLVHRSPFHQRLTPLATELSPTSWARHPGSKPWAINSDPFHWPRCSVPLGAGINSPGLLARRAAAIIAPACRRDDSRIARGFGRLASRPYAQTPTLKPQTSNLIRGSS